uniref:Myb-like domain-containing protein n=1 Tax=Oryza rufipogon TaxID=4529 RepID=A0A0E0R4J8_ORYRU
MPRRSASRYAAYWAADALAGDDALDFSLTKALVGVSPDSLTGAPEAVRERVALRCLQEVVSLASDGDCEATPTAGGVLSVDASRSCEDSLLQLIREIGSSGSLEKVMLLPFSQDVQKFICIKRPALPETSFELLREVYPEITPVVLPSPVEQNGNDQHDNVSHDLENTEKTGFNTDGAQLQQDDLANLVNESNTGNLQKDAMATPDFHQPCTSENRCFDQPQEDSINAVGVNIRSPKDSPTNVDRHIQVAAEPSLATSADLLGSNTGTISEQDMIDDTTMVQSQSQGVKNPNTLHYNNGDEPLVASIQSPKDSIHEGLTIQATVSPAFDRSNDALPASTSEISQLPEFITARDTVMNSEPRINKSHPNSPKHDTVDKANQDVDYGSVGIQKAAAFLSEDRNGATQGEKSEIKDPPENTAEHTKMFEQENSVEAQLEVGCSDKVNQDIQDDGNIMTKNMVCDGLNVQTAPEPHSCRMALHNKNLVANHLSEQNIGRNTTAVEKDCCSIPTSPQVVNDTRVKQPSNKRTMGNTVVETSHVHSSDDSLSGFAATGLLSMADKIPFCTQDQDANGPVEGLSEQDLCIKCGKDGQLLKCSSCLLAAHDTCFGSLATLDDSGQLYCPVCFYTKATEAYQKAKKTYSEARKNLSAFLGRKQLAEQHQQAAVGQRAANNEDHLNGCNDASKRKDNHQSEGNNLSHRDEDPTRKRKKQKTNATSDACAQEVVTEKVPVVQNSDVAPMNKHSVLQNNRKQAQVAEHEQPEENEEASGESGNDNSLHKTTHSSQTKCSPAVNQNVDADKENGLASSQQSEDSDEIEATSSNDSTKKSSPPWRKLRHRKAIYQDKDTAMPSNSKKVLGNRDQHMASPSRKRNYACPPKRYSNPIVPAGRRTKLCWTEKEEITLREAMAKFTPRDNGPIPWVQILEHGRDVFHRTRLPSDLRVKWRNMKKKSGS